MGQQPGFPQHEFAHRFQVMQRGLVAELAQGVAHLGKKELWLIPKTKQRLGATQLFPSADYIENFIRSHGVGPRITWIAAKRAVSAIIPAQVCKREKHFSG